MAYGILKPVLYSTLYRDFRTANGALPSLGLEINHFKAEPILSDYAIDALIA